MSLTRYTLFFALALIAWSNGKAQVHFIENQGQWEEPIRYKADIPSGVAYIENQGITYLFWDPKQMEDIHDHNIREGEDINYHAVKVRFEGAQTPTHITESQPTEAYYNYYLGNKPENWATGLHGHKTIVLHNLYPGIDLEFKGYDFGFKYSFIVHPNANPDVIKLHYEGANDLLINQGSLIATTSLTDITEEAPYSFQTIRGKEVEIPTAFEIQEGASVVFNLTEYQKDQTLIIDPSIIFSSLSGSLQDNWGFTATYDEDGNAYSAGTVYGNFYPTTSGAFQRRFASVIEGYPQRDCGIFKLSSDGTRLLFATYFGGRSHEQPHSLVVSPNGDLIVLGTTLSTDLPVRNPYQRNHAGNWEIFIANLSGDGKQLNGGTYLGSTGQDGVNGEYRNDANGQYRNTSNLVYNYGDIYRGEIITDDRNYVYIATTTESSNFPTLNGYDQTHNGQQDAVVVKMSPNLDSLIWSTFIGGQRDDAAYSLDLDDNNNVYVTGGTKGVSFPTTNNSYDQTSNGGMADAFLVKISANGRSLMNSTFIGTTAYDQAYFVKVGPDGSPWIYGQTEGAFPVKNTNGNTNIGMFITKFRPDLSDILISRRFGSGNTVNISPTAFTVDLCGRVYLSGWGGLSSNAVGGGNLPGTGNTTGLPTVGANADRTTDGRDFYISVYTEDLSTIIYATFFGGVGESGEHNDGGTSRFDKRGVIYQAICAACRQGLSSTPFPTTPGVHGPLSSHNDTTNCNNAIVKIDLEAPALFAEFEMEDVVCEVPQTISFTNYTEDATTFEWNMGDGTTYSDSNVTHTFTQPGTYKVQLVAYNPISCNLRDTVEQTIEVYAQAEADFNADIDICTKQIQLNRTGTYGKDFLWNFGNGATSTDENPSYTYDQEGRYRILLTADPNTDCEDTFSLFVTLEDPDIDFNLQVDSCDLRISTENRSKGYDTLLWDFGDGTSSGQFEPSHTFSTSGRYQVKLVTNLGASCEDTLTKTIDLLDPEAAFELQIDTCEQLVQFNNNSNDAQGYKWDFGFSTSKDENPSLVYPDVKRPYTVQLVAAPFSACADTAEITFRMPGQPEADFSVSPDTCLSAASFTANLVDAPNWIWYFGDGDSSTVLNPYHNFRDSGDFTVQLIAYPNSACPDTAEQIIDIDTFRFALFEVELDTCDFAIVINNLSEDLDSFSWKLGDGNQSNDYSPEHVYGNSGEYFIQMYGLKQINGCDDSLSVPLSIPPLPIPGNTQVTDSCINTFTFRDTSQFGENTEWFTPNGKSYQGQEVQLHYPRTGSYTLWMVSISEYGCRDTLPITVNVDSVPTARFNAILDSCIGAVQVQNRSIGNFRTRWYYGFDGSTRRSNPLIDFEGEGEFQVTMVINQGTECEDTVQRFFNISEYQTDRITIPNVFSPNGDGINDEWQVAMLRPDCDDYQLYIYNRWGQLVFQDEGIIDPWDGTTNDLVLPSASESLPTGTYFYILRGEIVERSGTITLLH